MSGKNQKCIGGHIDLGVNNKKAVFCVLASTRLNRVVQVDWNKVEDSGMDIQDFAKEFCGYATPNYDQYGGRLCGEFECTCQSVRDNAIQNKLFKLKADMQEVELLKAQSIEE